jgi:RHS repeat-associated protein
LKTYIQSDRLGSGRIASDEQGDVVGTVQLDEWGNVVAKNDPRGVLNSYTNHELDDVIGAYFAKARYYDPSIKRFLAFDPKLGAIGNPKSLNRYTYVFNSPIKFIDPNGEDASLPDYKDAVLGELSGILDIVIPSILAKLVTVEIILLLPNLISLEKIIVNIIADVGFVIMIEAGRITELQ